MKVSMIAAMSRNRVIGKDNDLPWHLPDDFEFFKQMTKHHHVIMGRKNFESLPHKFRPLPDRENIVISRQPHYGEEENIHVVQSLAEALNIAKRNAEKEAFIIGGGEIYKMGLALASTLYLTEIHADVAGDVYFPIFEKAEWKEIQRENHPADDRHKYSFDFVTYYNYKHLDL